MSCPIFFPFIPRNDIISSCWWPVLTRWPFLPRKIYNLGSAPLGDTCRIVLFSTITKWLFKCVSFIDGFNASVLSDQPKCQVSSYLDIEHLKPSPAIGNYFTYVVWAFQPIGNFIDSVLYLNDGKSLHYCWGVNITEILHRHAIPVFSKLSGSEISHPYSSSETFDSTLESFASLAKLEDLTWSGLILTPWSMLGIV